MTQKLRIDTDTLAIFLITSTWTEVARDPAEFIRTYDENFDARPLHFAEILIVDEFDCPDDLYTIFDIAEDEEDRMNALFDLKHDDRVYNLVTDALKTFRTQAPQLLPKKG